jgi:hypothetical protein
MCYVRVPNKLLMSVMAALGNDVLDILAGDNGMCYIHIPDERSQQTQQVLQQYDCVTIKLSDSNHDMLVGNTPMNLRRAIQAKALPRPDEKHHHLWKQVCARAGIDEESYAQTAFLALQYLVAFALFGRGEQKA